MVWKILSLVSAGCLAAACYFAWSNDKMLKHETRRKLAAEANLESVQKLKVEADEQMALKQAQLATLEKDRDAAKEDVVRLTAEAQEKENALAVTKSNLEQVSQQVATLKKQIEEAGDIESLVAQIEALQKDQQSAQGALANQEQRKVNVQSQIQALTAQITDLRDAAARASKGIVDPDFTARISQYFPEWDFAILNKGNSGGVFANADLEVKRGRDVIARLKVRNVEQGSSVAELVPGSLAEGQSIQSGDVVVAASVQTPKPQSTMTVPPAGAGAATPGAAPAPADPGAAPAMGSDPFGTPAPAPMNSDPFGAPAAPAPSAPMNSDPFGAPATPAPAPAPSAPMNSDPFGAPAAPMAENPAGGAGTPASPSTADPFAPKP